MGNLNLPQIAAAQAQKHQTSNDADEYLDIALTEVLVVSLAGGNVTLTAAQFREAMVFESSGNAVARDLTVPAVSRPFIVRNGGTATLTIRGGAGSPLGTATLATGETGLYYCDGSTLREVAKSAGSTADPYDVGASYPGAPTASVVLMRYPFPRQVIFPSGLTNSRGVAGTAATAQTDFDIKKNGSSVGTMRFAAAGTTATFIMASQTTFAAGDVLTVVAPGSPDATLADIGFGLAGTR
ncbi:MAG TPA: hypothetical protein PKC95_00040 [Thauera aminoaromatica]|nr:hypothetical protein [Thauera aminoaromatica]